MQEFQLYENLNSAESVECRSHPVNECSIPFISIQVHLLIYTKYGQPWNCPACSPMSTNSGNMLVSQRNTVMQSLNASAPACRRVQQVHDK